MNIKSRCLAMALIFANVAALFAQTDRQITNLKTFAKAYGYVKYFHPSAEASELDWGWFSTYGAQQVLACNSDQELIDTLNAVFGNVAPTVVFSAMALPEDKLNSLSSPENFKDYFPVYWQHYGVGKDMSNPSKLYQSVRVNALQKVESTAEFGGIVTQIDAQPYLGKRIRISSKAKLITQDKGTGHIWLRVDKKDKSLGFFNNMDESPIRSSDWKTYSFEGKVDPAASTINFGGFLKGNGSFFMDELEIFYEENGTWVPISVPNGDFEDADLKATKWSQIGGGVELKNNSVDKTRGTSSLEIRTKEPEYVVSKAIFDQSPMKNRFWIKEISPSIWINMPMVLYQKENSTYPSTATTVNEFIDKYEQVTPSTPDALEFRIGNLINAWNVFQHFYPYFDVVQVDWEKELEESLIASFSSDGNSHIDELKMLSAQLQDNHVNVYSEQSTFFAPGIRWEWIESQLIITQVYDPNLQIKTGDRVEEIDGQSPEDYFEKIKSGISAASDGWMNYRASIESLLGHPNSKVKIKVNGSFHELTRDSNFYQTDSEIKMTSPKYRFYGDQNQIAYLNLDLIPMDTINFLLPQLVKCKAIIGDLRGYPKSNHQFIQHLLTKPDRDKWMQVDRLIYPDHENPVGFSFEGWSLNPLKPYLGDKKIVFITDGQAVSYAESYMGFIEGYDLGTIVGQPTSGTNGNINQFQLPGNYSISFTGMRVLNHDGSSFHGVGIIPDIFVEKSIAGVKAGRDEFLEVALKLANQ